MKRTRKWHKKLTMKEIRHVNELCDGTLAGIKAQLEWQKTKNFAPTERCHECKTIARKLGLGK